MYYSTAKARQTFTLEPWAEKMAKVIHKVDPKINVGPFGGMGSQDGYYVTEKTAKRLLQQFKEEGYRQERAGADMAVSPKGERDRGFIVCKVDDEEDTGLTFLLFWFVD